MGKGELRLLCVASTIVLEGVRVPLSEAHCKDEQLLFLVMDSAMLDSGFPFWARCMHQYGGKRGGDSSVGCLRTLSATGG